MAASLLPNASPEAAVRKNLPPDVVSPPKGFTADSDEAGRQGLRQAALDCLVPLQRDGRLLLDRQQ